MLETKIVATPDRCYMLDIHDIPYSTYLFYGVWYFAFPTELNIREALDLFGI